MHWRQTFVQQRIVGFQETNSESPFSIDATEKPFRIRPPSTFTISCTKNSFLYKARQNGRVNRHNHSAGLLYVFQLWGCEVRRMLRSMWQMSKSEPSGWKRCSNHNGWNSSFIACSNGLYGPSRHRRCGDMDPNVIWSHFSNVIKDKIGSGPQLKCRQAAIHQ